MPYVLEVIYYFGKLCFEVRHPSADGLLLFAESAGDVCHRLGSNLWNEYPRCHNAPTVESVQVFAWRLIDPLPDAAIDFNQVFEVSLGLLNWLSEVFAYFAVSEASGEGYFSGIIEVVLIAHVLALCLRQEAFMSLNIVRVCAMCQQESKTVLPTVPNVAYSHGACRRHALITFEELLGKEKALEFVASKPDSYFCPEIINDLPAATA